MSGCSAETLRARIRDYWNTNLEKLIKQTDDLIEQIRQDMLYKINSWNLDPDLKFRYIPIIFSLIEKFLAECIENDNMFIDIVIEKHNNMLNLWETSSYTPLQIDQENYQFTQDLFRDLRAHRRNKEIKFDFFIDKKRAIDSKFLFEFRGKIPSCLAEK